MQDMSARSESLLQFQETMSRDLQSLREHQTIRRDWR